MKLPLRLLRRLKDLRLRDKPKTIMHRNELLSLLEQYRTPFVYEAGYVMHTRRFIQQHENCFDSTLWEGHVTGSAWVVNPTCSHALLLHHRKHDQWFQPGGHADGDADILRVSLRETREETGLPLDRIKLVSETIFDVDIHHIPASRFGPAHQHYDIRFLLEIDDTLPVPGNDESHEILWVPIDQVKYFNNNLSTYRMVQKTRSLRCCR